MKHTVVIGAGFGDEGKGMVTAAEVIAKSSCAVVRFNGGGQAGHTVQLNGVRHVFSHFGSGSLSGVPTLLTRRFILNPRIFLNEKFELEEIGVSTQVFASRSCQITTAFDVAINRAVEARRRGNRHGSCGVGINETVTRSENGHSFTLEQAYHSEALIERILLDIRDQWVPKRCAELGLNLDDLQSVDIAAEIEVIRSAAAFWNPLENFEIDGRHVVFEGAQGLMLDEQLGVFPHVTRSLTGVPFAIEAMNELGLEKNFTTMYVSRAYSTRHGAGQFVGEGNKIADTFKMVDLTNKPNDWQECIRVRPLNIDALKSFIQADMDRGNIQDAKLVLTCLDQVSGFVRVVTYDDHRHLVDVSDLHRFVARFVGIKIGYEFRSADLADFRSNND